MTLKEPEDLPFIIARKWGPRGHQRKMLHRSSMHDVYLDRVGATPGSSKGVSGVKLHRLEIDLAWCSSHCPWPWI